MTLFVNRTALRRGLETVQEDQGLARKGYGVHAVLKNTNKMGGGGNLDDPLHLFRCTRLSRSLLMGVDVVVLSIVMANGSFCSLFCNCVFFSRERGCRKDGGEEGEDARNRLLMSDLAVPI